MDDIFEQLERTAKAEARSLGTEALILRGVWQCNYVLRLSEDESVFHLNYVLAQTLTQGCCYYDPKIEQPTISGALIGKDVLESPSKFRSVRMAALDAVFGSSEKLRGSPDMSFNIHGSNIEKAPKRAKIVCDEVLLQLSNRPTKRTGKKKVVEVGVVGSFLKILTENNDLDIKATDLYPDVIGISVHGVVVENGTRQGSSHVGDRTLELVAEADLALVTGMTLANNSLSEILDIASRNKTAVVIFAETGAHFASEYCKMGVDAVVSEPFPFYLSCDGPTGINIFRRDVR